MTVINVDIVGNVKMSIFDVVMYCRRLINGSNVLVEGTVNTTA